MIFSLGDAYAVISIFVCQRYRYLTEVRTCPTDGNIVQRMIIIIGHTPIDRYRVRYYLGSLSYQATIKSDYKYE